MSSLERAAQQIDELAAKRRALKLAPVDFEQYAAEIHRDRANVKDAFDYQEDVADFYVGNKGMEGATMPWEKTHSIVRFRKAEVSCWHGYNKHGKSLVLGQVCNHLVQQGEKVCIASMEMLPYRTLARMTRQMIGTSNPSLEYINKYFDFVAGKIFLFDQQGMVSATRIINVIEYAAGELGVTHFVVDSLMKLGINTDDLSGQKNFVDRLCAAAKDTGLHIHLVAHDRKPDDESRKPSRWEIAGSSDISNQVDNCFGVWRNVKKIGNPEREYEEDAVIICDAQRNGEWTGEIKLWVDEQSYRYKGAQMEKVWSLL
jgi:twinkle protein